jgi:hypothetical protein
MHKISKKRMWLYKTLEDWIVTRNDISTLFYLVSRNEDFETQDTFPQGEAMDRPNITLKHKEAKSDAIVLSLSGLSMIILLITLFLIY